MRKCVRCGLISPDRSVQCQCGYHFDVDDQAAVVREHARWRSDAKAHLLGGILLGLTGVGVSLVSYFTAVEHGAGYYAIWTGAVIVGLTLSIRSLVHMGAIKDAEKPLP